MSKLDAAQWSSLWENDTITTIDIMFDKNYDLSIADFWHNVLSDQPESIVDLACGNGALVWLADEHLNKEADQCRVIGIDGANIDPFTVLQKNRADHPMVEFIGNTAIEKLPLPDASQDVVISQYGLEYSDLQQSIPEVARILKANGKMAFIMHGEDSYIVKASTEYLDQHKEVLDEIQIHRLYQELDKLIGKNRSLAAIASKPKVAKKISEVNAASARIKAITNAVGSPAQIKRYWLRMFNAFKPESIEKRIDRKKAIQHSTQDLAAYIDRVEDLKTAALSTRDEDQLIDLINHAGFSILDRQPLAYESIDNIGTALTAIRK